MISVLSSLIVVLHPTSIKRYNICMGREEHFIFNIPDILGTGQKFDNKVNIKALIY